MNNKEPFEGQGWDDDKVLQENESLKEGLKMQEEESWDEEDLDMREDQ